MDYHGIWFTISPSFSENEGDKKTLTEMYNEMSRILATNLRDCLKALEVDLRYSSTAPLFCRLS